MQEELEDLRYSEMEHDFSEDESEELSEEMQGRKRRRRVVSSDQNRQSPRRNVRSSRAKPEDMKPAGARQSKTAKQASE